MTEHLHGYPYSQDVITRLHARAESYRQSGPSAVHTADLLDEAAGIVEGWRERAERAEARCRVLSSALLEIQTWRRECHQYDTDMGFSLRSFGDDDFAWIESRAAQALSLSGGGGREEKGSLPESPSADAGPYPRSHDDQRSDGGRG